MKTILKLASVALIVVWIVIFFDVPVERSAWSQDILNEDQWAHKWEYDRSISVWLWDYVPVRGPTYLQYRERIELEVWVPKLVVLGVIAIGISWLAWRKSQNFRFENCEVVPESNKAENSPVNLKPRAPLPSFSVPTNESEWSWFGSGGSPLPQARALLSIARDGIEIGEWPEDQIQSLYSEGQLLPTDFYWREGMEQWNPLCELKSSSIPKSVVVPPPLKAFLRENRQTNLDKAYRAGGGFIVFLAVLMVTEALQIDGVIPGAQAIGGFMGWQFGWLVWKKAGTINPTVANRSFILCAAVGSVIGGSILCIVICFLLAQLFIFTIKKK